MEATESVVFYYDFIIIALQFLSCRATIFIYTFAVRINVINFFKSLDVVSILYYY